MSAPGIRPKRRSGSCLAVMSLRKFEPCRSERKEVSRRLPQSQARRESASRRNGRIASMAIAKEPVMPLPRNLGEVSKLPHAGRRPGRYSGGTRQPARPTRPNEPRYPRSPLDRRGRIRPAESTRSTPAWPCAEHSPRLPGKRMPGRPRHESSRTRATRSPANQAIPYSTGDPPGSTSTPSLRRIGAPTATRSCRAWVAFAVLAATLVYERV